MLGAPVLGSRTWMWQIAAPAFTAPKHALAISSGEQGRLALFSRVPNVPVTAHVKMVGRTEAKVSSSG